MALVLASPAGTHGTSVSELVLSPEPRVVREARDHAQVLADVWHLEAELDVLKILLSELVTNALQHTAGPITVRLVRLGDRVACEVYDSGRGAVWVSRPQPTADSGRGLAIVSALADRWGSRPTEDGKAVWFEVTTAITADGTAAEKAPSANRGLPW
ncbi:MAG: ATP-binding protein [Actinomycetes bacterium]